ncbi:hypothetical protein BpHYR1_030477 [Brachionus plicatilis]|uniref:Uncharacterized protein n=1 Tax=Brachionus plicatilis TaxID=10195 RepID=A0A3M7P7X0_BRAPC|nr:hypothetical protein BpHYR1_030477 [Brachionus plicatilis]
MILMLMLEVIVFADRRSISYKKNEWLDRLLRSSVCLTESNEFRGRRGPRQLQPLHGPRPARENDKLLSVTLVQRDCPIRRDQESIRGWSKSSAMSRLEVGNSEHG